MSLSCTHFSSSKTEEILDEDEDTILIKYISEIKNESTREKALTNYDLYDYYIKKSKEKIALFLWYSGGTVAVILQEMIKLYEYLTPKNTKKISDEISCKAVNVIFLFQCLASNPITKKELIESEILVYILPFLSLTPNSKNTYVIKITTLGMLHTLSENCDIETFQFLEKYEIIPKLLSFIIYGKEKEREYSFRIIQNVINNLTVLDYICQVKERIKAISITFKKILSSNSFNCSKLKKYTIKLLYHLSTENKEAKNIIKKDLYELIKNLSFNNNLDENGKNDLNLLIKILEEKNDINNTLNANSDSKIQKLKNDLNINNSNNINGNNNTQRQININNNEVNNNKLNLNMIYINNMNQFKINNNNNYMMPSLDYSLNKDNDNFMNNSNNNLYNQNNGFNNMNYYGTFKNI